MCHDDNSRLQFFLFANQFLRTHNYIRQIYFVNSFSVPRQDSVCVRKKWENIGLFNPIKI